MDLSKEFWEKNPLGMNVLIYPENAKGWTNSLKFYFLDGFTFDL